MLHLTELIGHGATRESYRHPLDRNKCVKILIGKDDPEYLKHEIKHYPRLKKILGDFIVQYDTALVDTDKGSGLVCELLQDDNGELSQSLNIYKVLHGLDADIKNQLDRFVSILLKHNLFFYDFNMKNFVVQIKNGTQQLKYIDLKSYRSNKSWAFLKLESFVHPFARIIMLRRLKRLYQVLDLPFHA